MKAKIMEKNDYTLKILFEDVPSELLSGIRRAIMQEVPSMAIDSILVLENNSVLHDEVLAHRLGMIPLISDKALEKYESPEKCMECSTCENCYTRLYLEVSNEDKDELVVYSGDFRPEDPDVKPVYPNIPIVVLGKGQKIVIEAEVRLGRGKEHIKWSPVSIATLISVPEIHYDVREAIEEDLEKCLSCIRNYSEEIADEIKKNKKGKITLYQFKNTSILRFCEEKHCKNLIKIKYLDNKRILTIESTGSLKPEKIVFEAIKILEEKTRKMQSIIQKIEEETK